MQKQGFVGKNYMECIIYEEACRLTTRLENITNKDLSR